MLTIFFDQYCGYLMGRRLSLSFLDIRIAEIRYQIRLIARRNRRPYLRAAYLNLTFQEINLFDNFPTRWILFCLYSVKTTRVGFSLNILTIPTNFMKKYNTRSLKQKKTWAESPWEEKFDVPLNGA